MNRKLFSFWLSIIMLLGVTIVVPALNFVNGEYVSTTDTSSPREVMPKANDNNDSIVIDEESEVTTYNYRPYDDYFVEQAIPENIEETTIDGDGLENSPYIINSTNDFIFLSKQAQKNIYVELNCDIILNDEIFDESGTPTGGDGEIFSWQSFSNAITSFDGREHTISGLYGKRIFNSTVKTLKNLKVENAYVDDDLRIVGTTFDNIDNCHVKGNIYAQTTGSAAGIGGTINNNISNSSFTGTIKTSFTSFNRYYNAYGLVVSVGNKVENCRFDGYVFGHTGTAGICSKAKIV